MRLTIEESHLNIFRKSDEPLLRNCYAAVELSEGSVYTTLDAPVNRQATEQGAAVHCPGTNVRPELRWQMQYGSADNELCAWLEIHNTTARPLAVERMDVLVVPQGFCSAPFVSVEAAQTGWQSWSPATLPLPMANQVRAIPGPIDAPILPASEAERFISPWMTLLRSEQADSFLVGFITARNQQSVVAVQAAAQGHRITASSYLEGSALAPGATVRSEMLQLIFESDSDRALDRYARTLAEQMQARSYSKIATGWCSWYAFFGNVTEADILRNLEYLAAHRRELPIQYVQIDAGYEAHGGDWLTPNERFPHGMQFLADEIHARGFKAGLWLCPFLVTEESQLYAEHPDWVLRDHNDEPLVATPNWIPFSYALDTTHPDVLEWIKQVTQTIVNEWGYDYLKLDYLCGGALRGKRFDRNATSVQAYRRGLELIRQVAGDKFVLGCGAPFLPSVGLVDGMRTGPDVAPFWRNPRDRIGSLPALFNVIRANVAHYWMHPHLWLNDPDGVIARANQSELTLAEVQSEVSLIALGGGIVMFSDDLSSLEPDRAALLPRLLPPYGEPAVPMLPYVDGLPMYMRLRVEREWGTWLVAALFNWHDEPRALTFNPSAWGISSSESYHLFDFWTCEHFGPIQGSITLAPTAAHGVRLLTVHMAREHPQLIGTNLHVLGEAVVLAAKSWSDNTLRLELYCPGEHSGELVMHVPSSYIFESAQGISPDAVTRQGNLLFLSLSLVDSSNITIHFSI